MIPCGTGLDIITPEERAELECIALGWAPFAAQAAANILAAVNDGVLPPQWSIDWFIQRFRSGATDRR